jgi:hypothetical protein
MTDLAAAQTFMATHARLLDRRHLAVVLGGGAPAGAALLSALSGHANPDGGFGWALEPDQRAESSQPVGALHALELLESALASGLAPEQALDRAGASGAATTVVAGQALASTPSPRAAAVALCDWLGAASLPGGGLPFSTAGAAAPGTARWWAEADPALPSLHITAGIASAGHRLADREPAVAAHPWLARVTEWCLGEIAQLTERPPAYTLRYVLWLLDAAGERVPAAAAELERVSAFVPAGGELPVEGGVEGERLRALDLSPRPDRPLRALVPADAVARHLDELEHGQRDDGGWTVDFPSASPAGEIEWRGVATVRALATLRAHGRL